MDSIISKVLQLQQTFVTLDELDQLIGPQDYAHFAGVIQALIEHGAIKPVGNRQDTNGKIPSLRMRYRILREREDDRSYLEEVKMLHPSLNISGYIDHIDLYKKHQSILLPLSEYLHKNAVLLNEPMSKNERSYSIWCDEKLLDQSLTQAVIRFNHLEHRLNYYLTPEPFFDFVRTQRKNPNILILENKDTWFTLRRLLTELPDYCDLFDVRIDVILYGEGNKINRPSALTDYGISNYGDQAHYYYFGDLDYAGIDLFLRVQKVNPDLNIVLFRELYEEMLRCSPKLLGEMKHHQNKPNDFRDFLAYFSPHIQQCISNILSNNQYIPQEILHYQILKQILIREGDDDGLDDGNEDDARAITIPKSTIDQDEDGCL